MADRRVLEEFQLRRWCTLYPLLVFLWAHVIPAAFLSSQVFSFLSSGYRALTFNDHQLPLLAAEFLFSVSEPLGLDSLFVFGLCHYDRDADVFCRIEYLRVARELP